MSKYRQIPASQVPEGVRFDVPRHNQGQIVEIAYGGHSRAEHGHGDPYQRVTDRSDGSVTYYALVPDVNDAQIKRLRIEADTHGDLRQSMICALAVYGESALDGADPGTEADLLRTEGRTQEWARAHCARVIADADASASADTYSVYHGGSLRGSGRYAGPGLSRDQAREAAHACRAICGGDPRIEID